jgi:hypothetical protein
MEMKLLVDAFEKMCESPADKAARRFREQAARRKAAKAPYVPDNMVPGKDGVTFDSVVMNPGPNGGRSR